MSLTFGAFVYSTRGDLAPTTIRQRDRLEVDVAPTTVSEDDGLEVDVAPTTVSEDENCEEVIG